VSRSKTSGTIVLHHEIGHNFINVGEEYDGGQVYAGVNSGDRVDQLPWMHWLTEPGMVREERLRLAAQEYVFVVLAMNVLINLQ
jgi:hypothetical protein